MDRRDRLEAQLEELWDSFQNAPVEAKAGLSREIRLVLKELEGLPDGEVLSLHDALGRRRTQKAANS